MELDPRGPCPSAAARPRTTRLAGRRRARGRQTTGSSELDAMEARANLLHGRRRWREQGSGRETMGEGRENGEGRADLWGPPLHQRHVSETTVKTIQGVICRVLKVRGPSISSFRVERGFSNSLT